MSPEEWAHGGGRVGNDAAQSRPPGQAGQTREPSHAQGGQPKGDDHFKISPPSVYQAIVDHQRDADWWGNRDDLVWLRHWADMFIREFQIKTKDGCYLPLPLIKIEPLNIKTLVTYRPWADGFALTGTIAVNEKHLQDVADCTLLAQLLRALLRAWQRERCADDRFDRETRATFKSLGLVVTKDRITIEAGGRFQELLHKHGIAPPAHEIPVPKPAGRSTLALWSCFCQKVRVGAKKFEAKCLRCQADFRPGDHVIFRWSEMVQRDRGAT